MNSKISPKDLIHFAKERFATKTFDPNRKVSDEDMSTLIEIARLSPSSCGLEPWRVIDVESHALRNKILPHSMGAQRGQMNASNYLVVAVAKSKYYKEENGIVKSALKDNLGFDESLSTAYSQFISHMFDSRPEECRDYAFYDWSNQQAHLLIMNIAANAAIMGIDTCMIGGFDAAKYDEILGEGEGLYDTDLFSAGVCLAIGYRAAESGHEKHRMPMSTFYKKVE